MLFLCGNVETLNNSIFTAIDDVVKFSLTLLGTMCFWSGIMQIASKTKIMNGLKKMLKPILRILFPDEQNDDKVQEEISMNMIANILGLGNAATPLGIKAMKTLQKDNKNKMILSNSMLMFILINTASIQLIPTNVIAIRNSLNSSMSTQIIFPVWIATITAALASIITAKVLIRLGK